MAQKDLPMDDIIRDYQSGMGTIALGERYGVHATTIARRLGKAGVVRSVREAVRYRHAQVVSLGDLQGMAAELGLTPVELRDLLVRHGFMSAVSTDPGEIARRYAGEPSKPRKKRRAPSGRKVFSIDASGRPRRERGN